MNLPASPVSEDDLQAYVDGRLSDARRVEIDGYLADHPDVAARVASERVQREALRDRLAPKYAEPIPARLRISSIRAAQYASRSHWMRNAAAALVLVTAGAAGGWFARSPNLAQPSGPAAVTVAQDAVSAYRTFVVEVAHPVEVGADKETHLLQWLSKRLGRTLRAPDLASFGFKLMGGRLLPAGNGAAAMLMYDDDHGTRLSVYIRAGEGSETAFRFRKDGEVSTFDWLDQGFGFAVSASTARERLLPISEAVYHSFDSVLSTPLRGG